MAKAAAAEEKTAQPEGTTKAVHQLASYHAYNLCDAVGAEDLADAMRPVLRPGSNTEYDDLPDLESDTEGDLPDLVDDAQLLFLWGKSRLG